MWNKLQSAIVQRLEKRRRRRALAYQGGRGSGGGTGAPPAGVEEARGLGEINSARGPH